MNLNYPYILAAVFIMALVTYLPRMLPLVLFRKKISNPFIRSFLGYVPYAVLAAMTFPSILFATSSVLSAIFGMITALILAYFRKGLLTVALAATAVVFMVEQLLRIFS
ncbi:MAG: AzlD domain-containing protein [Candidatus Merdivicinus sp.]|jgi:branched-subunit amino acid transport protein